MRQNGCIFFFFGIIRGRAGKDTVPFCPFSPVILFKIAILYRSKMMLTTRNPTAMIIVDGIDGYLKTRMRVGTTLGIGAHRNQGNNILETSSLPRPLVFFDMCCYGVRPPRTAEADGYMGGVDEPTQRIAPVITL